MKTVQLLNSIQKLKFADTGLERLKQMEFLLLIIVAISKESITRKNSLST